MFPFLTAWLSAFLVYLWLAASGGPVLGLWAWTELGMAAIVATVVACGSFRAFGKAAGPGFLRPKRILLLVAYACGPFLAEMARANIAVAVAVITGRIRPGVLRVRTGLSRDDSLTLLANSITLTPGTLTVDVDDASRDLFVHCLNVPDGLETGEAVPASRLFAKHDCARWVRRITGDGVSGPVPPPAEGTSP